MIPLTDDSGYYDWVPWEFLADTSLITLKAIMYQKVLHERSFYPQKVRWLHLYCLLVTRQGMLRDMGTLDYIMSQGRDISGMLILTLKFAQQLRACTTPPQN